MKGHSITGVWRDEVFRWNREYMFSVAEEMGYVRGGQPSGVHGPVSGLSREAIRLHVVDRARAVGAELPRGPFRASVARSPFEVMNDAIRESMAETNDLLQRWAHEWIAQAHARREVAIIAVLARHSWAWEVLGVNQWCEQRRSS